MAHARQRVNGRAERKPEDHGNQHGSDDDAERTDDLLIGLARDEKTHERIRHL